MNAEDIIKYQDLIRRIPVTDNVLEYVVNLVTKTRPNNGKDENNMTQYIEWGAGPRASQFMLLATKCHAAINGKYSPDIEDVKAVAKPILRHRLVKNYKAEAEGISVDNIIENLMYMILPIIAFGSSVLRKKCDEISLDYPDLDVLLENMWETMYESSGVGLAAPQINKSIRLFLIDTTPFMEEGEEDKAIKKTFINAVILDEEGDEWMFNEGCLSIPDIREDIQRKPIITIKYQDEHFDWNTDVFDGLTARVIQHEYDHIEGVLFTDKISPLRKRMIKRKLEDISKGDIEVGYRMKFNR